MMTASTLSVQSICTYFNHLVSNLDPERNPLIVDNEFVRGLVEQLVLSSISALCNELTHGTITCVFVKSCVDRNVLLAQMLHKAIPTILEEIDDDRFHRMFMHPSVQQDIQIMKWLHSTFACFRTLPAKVIETAFIVACESKGRFPIMEWLADLYHATLCASPESLSHAFQVLCDDGKTHLAKWLVATFPCVDVHDECDRAILVMCTFHHFKMAKWFLHKYPNAAPFGSNAWMKCMIQLANEDAKLPMLKWFFKTTRNTPRVPCKSHSYLTNWNAHAFCSACRANALHSAQWIISVSANVPSLLNATTPECESIFYESCKKHHFQIARLLAQLNPQRYQVCTRTDDGTGIERIDSFGLSVVLNMLPECVCLNDVPEENRICMVCNEKEVEVSTTCNHLFCKDCMIRWKKTHIDYLNANHRMEYTFPPCPACRTEVVVVSSVV